MFNIIGWFSRVPVWLEELVKTAHTLVVVLYIIESDLDGSLLE
jgi:hypothetical protein